MSSLREPRFNVYKVRYHLAMPDPDVVGPRYHTVVFVETEEDLKGQIHHVTGDLVSEDGMHYESQPADRPEEDATRSFFNKELLGTISASDYANKFCDICAAQPTPPKQKAFNIQTMKTEPIKPDGSFYTSRETRLPLFKCTEWTETYAIPALMQAGLIR